MLGADVLMLVFVLSLHMCVQDGGKALEEAMSHNTSVTECDIRLSEVDEQIVSSINQVVWTNQGLGKEGIELE